MIRGLIDFALRNRLMILGASLVLFAWGIFSFHALPIEAYPDVADTYAQVITQWPGHAAEEVEQQITVPLEVILNGVAHMTHLRSTSLAGVSDLIPMRKSLPNGPAMQPRKSSSKSPSRSK